jgi:hypothetical protein
MLSWWTGMGGMGPTYIMSPFSTLYGHVKDVDIRLDQTERLQAATRLVYKTSVTPVPADTLGS